MENSSSDLDNLQLDNMKCWSIFYIDENDNVMHDMGWRDDENAITLGQLLMGIKYTDIIIQSLQVAYLDYLESDPVYASKIGEIIEFIDSNTEMNPENNDYVSPLLIE